MIGSHHSFRPKGKVGYSGCGRLRSDCFQSGLKPLKLKNVMRKPDFVWLVVLVTQCPMAKKCNNVMPEPLIVFGWWCMVYFCLIVFGWSVSLFFFFLFGIGLNLGRTEPGRQATQAGGPSRHAGGPARAAINLLLDCMNFPQALREAEMLG